MSVLTEKEALHRSRASCLQNVKNLNCWGSNIHDISVIRKMINLQVLNLSANNVTTLKDICYCPRLKEIYLRKNQLKSIDEIKYLKNLPQLNVLWLADNPCAMEAGYRDIVINSLPNLKKFDSLEITEEERNRCAKHVKIEEIDLPNFENMDLSHTLTFDEVKSKTHLSYNGSEVSKPKGSMFSRQPQNKTVPEQKFHNELIQSSVDIDAANKRRSELGIKNLNISSLSFNGSTHNSLCKSYNDKTRNANILSAIYLLMNDLDENELHEISLHANQLVVKKTKNSIVVAPEQSFECDY